MAIRELDDATHAQIEKLGAEGDEFLEQENYSAAIERYEQAWQLLPEPRNNWDAATWLIASIGDAKYFANDYSGALAAFTRGVLEVGGLGNPFFHMRIGECCYELGQMERAGEELARAYMIGGEEVFQYEDKKYFELVRKVLKLPHA